MPASKVSKVQKGNYYKRKTKKWLEDKGFTCEYIEQYKRYWNEKQNRAGFVKRDLFGSDVLAMNGEQVIFANSVFGIENIAEHYKRYMELPFPKDTSIVQRWIVVWQPRVREPEIIEVGKT